MQQGESESETIFGHLVFNASASTSSQEEQAFGTPFFNRTINIDDDDTTFSNGHGDNDTWEFVPYSSRPETYIVPILFAIIFIIGILGNGTLIYIFIRHRTMRNVPNMYIVSLSVGDLFVILFAVPFTSTMYTVESWPYGEFVCKFSEFIKDLSIGVSVFTLTALSADRYFAIVDPMRKLHGRRATRITCLTIAGIWALSIVMALPSLFSFVRVMKDPELPEEIEGADQTEDETSRPSFSVCYPFPLEFGEKYPQVMVMLHFLVYYAIPLAFIGTFYIIMARHLVLSTRNMPGEAQGQGKQIQARKKVAKMILSFVVIFAICFFPTHLFMLWFYFYPNAAEEHYNDFWHYCRIVGFCLSFINSCINPITLYCVSGTFRKQFNEHLFCCCCNADGHSRPRRHAGFGCGCVSLSSTGQMYGGEMRGRNGYIAGRGMVRGSTTNSVNGGLGTGGGGGGGGGGTSMVMKRKSTWDTQSTMSHHLYTFNNNAAHNNNPNSNNPVVVPVSNHNHTSNYRADRRDASTNNNPNGGSRTPDRNATLTPTPGQLTNIPSSPPKHSITLNIITNPSNSSMSYARSSRSSLKHSPTPETENETKSNCNPHNDHYHHQHPNPKEYQDYLNRINALEKGEMPMPLKTENSLSETTKLGNVSKTKLAQTKVKGGQKQKQLNVEKVQDDENPKIATTSFITKADEHHPRNFTSTVEEELESV